MADFANTHKPLFKDFSPYFLYTLLPAGFSFHKLTSVGRDILFYSFGVALAEATGNVYGS